MDSRMGMSQLQTIKIDGMSREETTVRSLTPPEGHEDERLESSAVGISRLDPRSGTRRVALCGRRGVRTAVPALARGRTSLHGPQRDRRARSPAAQTLSELRVRAGRHPCPHRDTGKGVRRICGARARRCDRANGPSSVHWYLVAEAGEIKLLRET